MVNKLSDFVIKYSIHKDREVIKKYVQEHISYGTCDFVLDKNDDVIFFCRWNINGDTAHVLDLVISPKYRFRHLIKWVILRNILKYPYVTKLSWEREKKYPNRKNKVYNIKEVLQWDRHQYRHRQFQQHRQLQVA